MSTIAIPGFTGQLFVSTGAASSSAPAGNIIAECEDVTLTITADELDAFSKDSAGWDEVVYGKRKWTATGKAIYHDSTGTTGQATLWDSITNRTNLGVTWRATSSSGIIQYIGTGLVNKFELQDPNNGVVAADFSIRGTGTLIRVPSTS